MTVLYLVLFALALILFFLFGWLYVVLKLRALKRQQAHRSAFFRMAASIVDNDKAPFELVGPLHFFALTMGDFKVILVLTWVSVRNKLRIPLSAQPPSEFIEAIRRTTPSVRRQFFEAYEEAVKAISYRSIFLGPLIRSGIVDRSSNSDSDCLKQTVIRTWVRGAKHHKAERLDPIAACGIST